MAISTTTAAVSTNQASPVLSFGFTADAGDLIIALAGRDGSSSHTWPGSWVELADAPFTNAQATIAYLIAAGGETSVQPTSPLAERWEVIFVRVPAGEWHGTTPPEISTVATGSSVSPDPGSLTPSWGSEATTWIASCFRDDITIHTATAYPTNYDTAQTDINITTSACNVACAVRVGHTAASEDPGAFTISAAETWAAYTIAVRPAAGGATFALAGTAAATATMTGAVNHSYALAGTAPAVASLTGAVAIAYPLAGLAAATAAMTGAITHSYTLAGTAAATANMTGDATVAGGGATFALSGTADATASMSGAVGIAYGLAGEAQASASMTGAISHVYGLAGIAASVATLVGDLTLEGLSVDGDADLDFPDIFSATFASSNAYAAVLTFSSQYEATLAEMATEQDLNDTARPTVTFSVDGTPTDPTTVSLLVEKPDKTRTTYTYAQAQITKSGTGVYYRDVSLDAAGNWRFVFTGTGACAASVEGVVTVVG
jgi:hypothetical protein